MSLGVTGITRTRYRRQAVRRSPLTGLPVLGVPGVINAVYVAGILGFCLATMGSVFILRKVLRKP